MTSLAHDLVMLRIPFDSLAFWRNDDPYYRLWLEGLVDRVAETTRKQNKKS
jgi:hypothetical protein